jgi:hypothetical protein
MPLTAEASVKANRLEFDAAEFRTKFPDYGFKIQHHLCDEPAFQLPRLVELAKRLPAEQVEYYAGNVSVAQRKKEYPKNGLSIVETIRRIEECGSWMVLKNVEGDPEYESFLRALLGEWYGQIDPRKLRTPVSGMHREHAFIFISSPNSVTPFHLDDEHNFLLQIRGSKRVHMWDQKDRTVVSEDEMESHLQLWHDPDHERYLPFTEEFQERASVFELNSGEGLHFPFAAPHWVKNGPQVSISFSVTFRSDLCERAAVVYYINRRLRKLGLNPTPPHQSGWRDALKVTGYDAARRTLKVFRKSR